MGNLYWNDSDPMEKRIQHTLREWESAPTSDWDSPPDRLWHKIGPEIASPKRTWLFWKWLIPAVGVVAMAIILYFVVKSPLVQEIPGVASPRASAEEPLPKVIHDQHARNSPIEKPDDQSGTLSPEKKSVFQQKNSLRTGEPNPVAMARSSSRSSSGWGTNAIVGGGLTPGTGGVTAKGNGSFSEIPMLLSETNKALQDAPPAAQEGNHGNEARPSQEIIRELPEALPRAPVGYSVVAPLPLNSGIKKATPAELSMSVSSTRRAPLSSRFFAGLTIAQNLSYRTIQSNRPLNILPPFLRENESAALTSEMGIRMGWHPSSRFAVSGGLGLYNVGLQSIHQFRVPFDPGRENPAGNDSAESNYSLSVPSAYGDATVEVGLRRPNQQQVPPGQNIRLRMTTDLNLQYISIPINAYYFAGTGRFSIGIKAGLALNILQKQDFSASVQIMERGLGSRTVNVQPRLEPMEKVIPDLQVGAALWYRPGASWMLSVEPSYRSSLKPAVSREFFNVSQYALGIQLGVQKFF